MYVSIGPDGKPVVVDADGNPVDSPPLIIMTKDENGFDKATVYYPDSGQGFKFDLPLYAGSLKGCCIHTGPDGKAMVVDADGKPLTGQPEITKLVAGDGKATYHASFSGAKPDAANALSIYSPSTEGCYAHAGPDGKVTVVDEKGKPLACQPVITKIPDANGKLQYFVSYPGDKGSTPKPISWYLPASGGSKPGTGQGSGSGSNVTSEDEWEAPVV